MLRRFDTVLAAKSAFEQFLRDAQLERKTIYKSVVEEHLIRDIASICLSFIDGDTCERFVIISDIANPFAFPDNCTPHYYRSFKCYAEMEKLFQTKVFQDSVVYFWFYCNELDFLPKVCAAQNIRIVLYDVAVSWNTRDRS